MSIQVQGNAGTVVEVETNTRAMRVVQRPTDVGSLGAYAMGLASGTMAAGIAGAAQVWTMRNSTTNAYVIRALSMSMGSLGTGFAAGSALFNLFFARSFTVNLGAGTAATLTGNNGKLKTAFATTGIADLRISSTAILTGSSYTLDAQPLAGIQASITTAASTVFVPTTSLLPGGAIQGQQWPIVVAQNEGLILQATVPATGTWQFYVNLEWEELASY
jgi:hypothetical protein